MAEIKEGAPLAPASRRPDEHEEHDSIRRDQQRDDHADHDAKPKQQVEPSPEVPDYDLAAQPIENGRQPARPGQPGRWEEHPGDRDKP